MFCSKKNQKKQQKNHENGQARQCDRAPPAVRLYLNAHHIRLASLVRAHLGRREVKKEKKARQDEKDRQKESVARKAAKAAAAAEPSIDDILRVRACVLLERR